MRRNMMPAQHPFNINGFSLVETMIALLVLGMGIVAIAAMQATSVNSADYARRTIVDTVTVGQQLEQIMAMPYSDDLLADLDGAYLLQQPDHGPYAIAGINGTIEWEVDDDFPSVNTKRITVTVSRSGRGGAMHRVRYNYVKAQGYTQ